MDLLGLFACSADALCSSVGLLFIPARICRDRKHHSKMTCLFGSLWACVQFACHWDVSVISLGSECHRTLCICIGASLLTFGYVICTLYVHLSELSLRFTWGCTCRGLWMEPHQITRNTLHQLDETCSTEMHSFHPPSAASNTIAICNLPSGGSYALKQMNRCNIGNPLPR